MRRFRLDREGLVTMGTLIVDERVVPIIDLKLEDSAILFIAQLLGPVPAMHAESDVRIHGQDGTLVMSGRIRLDWDDVYPGDILEFQFRSLPVDKEFVAL